MELYETTPLLGESMLLLTITSTCSCTIHSIDSIRFHITQSY